MNLAYRYLIEGIIESGIVEDGGDICYQEIPLQFAIIVASLLTLFNFFLFFSIKVHLRQHRPSAPTLFEKVFVVVSIFTTIWQTYYKMSTKKGLFMLNPCHINLIFVVVLALSKNTPRMQKMYICWQAWLFGPLLSLAVPHLNGLENQWEVFVYYLQHILIVVIGPIMLQYRYGLEIPKLKTQILGFSTMGIYQCMILTTVSRLTKVNLNFTLCHSPADPFAKACGHWYYLYGYFYLNFGSYVVKWLMYPIRWLVGRITGYKQGRLVKDLDGWGNNPKIN